MSAPFTKAELELLYKFRTDIPFAMATLLRVKHRDRKGVMVPLLLKPAQQKFHDLVERIRAFEIAKQISPFSDAHKIAKRVMGRVAPGLRYLIKQLFDFGIDRFLIAARELGHEFRDGPVLIVVGKCRRGGISAYCSGRITLMANFNPAFQGVVMAHKGDNVNLIFKYHRHFQKFWPDEHLKFRVPLEKERDGHFEWDHAASVRVQTAGGKEGGRGDQADVYHFSEPAFYPDYNEVRGTLAARPKHGWVWEESTANGPGGGYADRWEGALDFDEVVAAYENGDGEKLDGWNKFFRYFFSWLEEPEYVEEVPAFDRDRMIRNLDSTERALQRMGASIEQLRWRREKMSRDFNKREGAANDGLSPEQWFAQEYPATPEEMFQQSGSTVYSGESLDLMAKLASQRRPQFLHIDADGLPEEVNEYRANLTVWEPPRPGHQYVIGGDPAKGLKHGDWSVGVVLDRLDGSQAVEAATLRLKIEPARFADMLVLLAQMYNDAFLVPEINGPGFQVCHRIVRELQYPFIYHRRTRDLMKQDDDDNTFRFGWLATQNTKHEAAYGLQKAVVDGNVLFRTPQLIRELRVYRNNDGKLGAPGGKHDDCVSAAYLAWFGHTSAAPPVDYRKLQQARRKQEMDPHTRSVWEDTKREAMKRWRLHRHEMPDSTRPTFDF